MKSFRGHGGYSYKLNLSESSPSQVFQEALVDSYTGAIIIEGFVKNFQFELLNYIYLEILVDYSGFFSQKYRTIILKTAVIIGMLDYPKLVLEVIFVFLVVYYIIDFFKFIYYQNKGYDKWALDQIEKLTSQTKVERMRTQPEIFRKLGFLITFDVFLNVFFLVMSSYFIYLRLGILVNEIYLTNRKFI